MKQQVNLAATLPKPPKYWLTPMLLLQMLGIFLLLLLLISGYHYVRYFMQTRQINSLEFQQKFTLQTLNTMATSSQGIKLNLEVTQLSKELSTKTALLASIAQQPTTDCSGFSDYLASLAKANAPGVWLRKIILMQDGNVQLNGSSLVPAAALTFLQQLNKQPCFVGKDFKTFKWLDTNGKLDGIDFMLSTQGLTNGTTASKAAQ
jgi:hypothetical protein